MGHSKHITSSTKSLLLAREVDDIVRGDDDKFKSSKHKLSTKHLAPVDNTKQYPEDPKHVAAHGDPKDSEEIVDSASTKVVRKSPIMRQKLPKHMENTSDPDDPDLMIKEEGTHCL